MDVIPQSSLLLGIIPALILLYIGLKGYEGHYKEKNIFLTFVLGIILGFFAAISRLLINAPPLIVIYVILFPLFEQLFKTIVLNIGRLHEKRETTIYGLSLGLGFGSVFTPFLIIAGSSNLRGDIYSLSLIAIGSVGIILFHGATGAYIGYGIYVGKMTRYLMTAVIFQIPFNLIMDMTRIYPNDYILELQLGLVIYGGIVFWYVVKKIMPKILSRSRRRDISRKSG